MARKTPPKKPRPAPRKPAARKSTRTAPPRKTAHKTARTAPRRTTGSAHAKAHSQNTGHSSTAEHAHRPDVAALFEKMTAPFMAAMTQAAAGQNADLSKMAATWVEGQRRHWQAAETTFSPFAQMADLPGLGYFRERHEDLARFYKAWQAHEAAQQKYSAEISRLMLDALAQFEGSLAAPQDAQQAFSSLKGLYARWVGMAEDAYARFAASPAHARLYGDVVNTLASLRHEMTVLTDQWAARLNLPTRAEVDSLHRHVHDLRRDNRAIRRLLQERPAPRSGRRRT